MRIIVGRELRKTYSTPRGPILAVDGVDLDIERGEFVAISGRSGSGKSTLLGMLGGLCRPTSGEISVEGIDLGALSRGALADFRVRRLGFMFQSGGLLPSQRVIDNVALPALLAGKSYAEAYERARELLGRVGLDARWDAHPGELSGGQLRRIALARALVNRPLVLLADEPTNDLDEQAEREVIGTICALRRAYAATLVVVTHDAALARLADRVIQMSSGRVLVSSPAPCGDAGKEEQDLALAARRLDLAAASAEAELAFEPAPPALVPAAPTVAGEGLGRFLVGFVGWALAIACVLLAINFGAARLQRRTIDERAARKKVAEQLALQSLRADIDDVETQPDGSHVVRVYLQTFTPERPFYVLGPSLRAFVQIDQAWQPLPTTESERSPNALQLVTSKHVFTMSLRADVARFDELVKGYMHVRIRNVMIVGEHADGSGDLFSRTDDYYIYLRPPNVTDDEIRQRNGWKAGAVVPRWIAMPAH